MWGRGDERVDCDYERACESTRNHQFVTLSQRCPPGDREEDEDKTKDHG